MLMPPNTEDLSQMKLQKYSFADMNGIFVNPMRWCFCLQMSGLITIIPYFTTLYMI